METVCFEKWGDPNSAKFSIKYRLLFYIENFPSVMDNIKNANSNSKSETEDQVLTAGVEDLKEHIATAMLTSFPDTIESPKIVESEMKDVQLYENDDIDYENCSKQKDINWIRNEQSKNEQMVIESPTNTLTMSELKTAESDQYQSVCYFKIISKIIGEP